MISYEPFWNTLKSKNVTTYALIVKHGISSATIDRIKKRQGDQYDEDRRLLPYTRLRRGGYHPLCARRKLTAAPFRGGFPFAGARVVGE